MARFLAMLVACVVTALMVIALLPWIGVAKATAEIAWTASLYAEKTRIAHSVTRPRILAVGGSGTLFSFDAQKVQQRLGRPVINFGTHAGLGLDYILERAAREVRPGDTIFLAPEYELLLQTTSLNEYAIQMTAFYDRAHLSHVPWRAWGSYLLGYGVLTSLSNGVRTMLGHPPPQRNDITLDPLGDARGNSVANSKWEALRDAAPALRPIAPEMVTRLRAFAAMAAKHQIKIIAIPPAVISTPGYTAPAFRAFQYRLMTLYAELGMSPLEDPAIGFLPPEDMYDSIYHANDNGRGVYTDRVLATLCRTMACRP
jgi:hypothetical protein